MSHVFVLSSDQQPLDPCHPARARQLLTSGRAAVFRRFPFTIILRARTAAESVVHEHRLKLDHGGVQRSANLPLKDAAAVHATRWALQRRLRWTFLPVETGTGGRTKFNRTGLGLAKAHWTDAACVGASTPETLDVRGINPLRIMATGHGNRQMAGLNKYGFPIRHRSRQKRHDDFRTGDLVRAIVPVGKREGTHVGRVLVRASGSFDIRTPLGRQAGIHARWCHVLHRSDGYCYQEAALPPQA